MQSWCAVQSPVMNVGLKNVAEEQHRRVLAYVYGKENMEEVRRDGCQKHLVLHLSFRLDEFE